MGPRRETLKARTAVIQFLGCKPKLLLLIGAPVAQLDRASGYEPEGREFDSLRAHHFFHNRDGRCLCADEEVCSEKA